MVALFAMQAAQRPRATTDIDVLANARGSPSGTTWAARRLEELGATLTNVDGLDGQRGFRFELESTTLRCQRASRSHASEPPAPRTRSWWPDEQGARQHLRGVTSIERPPG